MQILLYLIIKAGFHLSRIRNVFISIELIFISLIFLASGGECIKDNDVGVRLSTLNLLKSLCTFNWKGKKKQNKKHTFRKCSKYLKIVQFLAAASTEILMPKILNVLKYHGLNTVQYFRSF